MSFTSTTLGLAALGFALGWSVAWPPGPINAEILRRSLSGRFWPAASIGFGACTGDAAWALAVALGASALAGVPAMIGILWWISRILLCLLAGHYLLSAYRHWQSPPLAGSGQRFDSTRSAFGIGFVLALTSPWNLGFWIGVMGRPELAGLGTAAALTVAAAVIAGAASWVAVLTLLATSLQRWLNAPYWDVGARVLTALLLLAFAFA